MKKVSIFTAALCAMMLAGCAAGDNSAMPSAETATQTAQATPGTEAVTQTAEVTQSEQTAQDGYRKITPSDAKALIGAEGVVLLDVRTQDEFNEAHIDGAVLVPYDAIDQYLDKLPESKDTTIIVYCRSGRRSAIAADTLLGMGYTQVFDLGGIQDWPYETVTG